MEKFRKVSKIREKDVFENRESNKITNLIVIIKLSMKMRKFERTRSIKGVFILHSRSCELKNSTRVRYTKRRALFLSFSRAISFCCSRERESWIWMRSKNHLQRWIRGSGNQKSAISGPRDLVDWRNVTSELLLFHFLFLFFLYIFFLNFTSN